MEEIDWSQAPEGTTHWTPESDVVCSFLREDNGVWFWWSDSSWVPFYGKSWESQLLGIVKRPSLSPWNGTGLPPVGTVCEVCWTSPDEYYRVKVLAHDDGKAVYRWQTGPCSGELSESEGGILGKFSKPHPRLRPIRTPEQIAAEEREKAVIDMAWLTPWPDADSTKTICAALYDAGCRMPGGAQ